MYSPSSNARKRKTGWQFGQGKLECFRFRDIPEHTLCLATLAAVGCRQAQSMSDLAWMTLSSKSHLFLLYGLCGALVVVKTLVVIQIRTAASRQGLEIFFVESFQAVSWLFLTSGGGHKVLKEILMICSAILANARPWDRYSIMKSWLLAVTNMDCLAGLAPGCGRRVVKHKMNAVW